MKARYQYRFYPSEQQQRDLAKLFGCVRVVWNDALALCKTSEKLPSVNELQKLGMTQAKKREERSWLSEVSNIPLQESWPFRAGSMSKEPSSISFLEASRSDASFLLLWHYVDCLDRVRGRNPGEAHVHPSPHLSP